MFVFVHAQGIKTIHTGGSKNGKILSTQLLNDPFSQAVFFPGFDTIETSKTNKECPFFDMAFSRFMRFGSSLKCPQGNLQASFVLIDFEQTLTLARICNSKRGAGKEGGGNRPSRFCSFIRDGCDTFDPKRIWSLADIWSPQIGPPKLVPPNWSPIDWSLCTNGPQPIQSPKIWSPWTNGPRSIWSPQTNGPQNILFVQGDKLWGSRHTGTELVGDHLSMGDQISGNHLSRGINFMGIVCPGGQEVWDRKSGDQMGLRPNGFQPVITFPSIFAPLPPPKKC